MSWIYSICTFAVALTTSEFIGLDYDSWQFWVNSAVICLTGSSVFLITDR